MASEAQGTPRLDISLHAGTEIGSRGRRAAHWPGPAPMRAIDVAAHARYPEGQMDGVVGTGPRPSVRSRGGFSRSHSAGEKLTLAIATRTLATEVGRLRPGRAMGIEPSTTAGDSTQPSTCSSVAGGKGRNYDMFGAGPPPRPTHPPPKPHHNPPPPDHHTA